MYNKYHFDHPYTAVVPYPLLEINAMNETQSGKQAKGLFAVDEVAVAHLYEIHEERDEIRRSGPR
jgi:hypothetical protein